ncbi:MAG: DEAD/DEAH box helicase [Saccharothrix sp.]|nr:DEAD/DEAH box helicase [Saccharothrix sp.]
MSDDIGNALVAAVDAGAIGHAEISVAAALAAVVRQGRTLGFAQVRSAQRILERYREQVQRAGVTVPVRTTRPVAAIAAEPPSRDAPVVRTQWVTRRTGKPPRETREMRITVTSPWSLKPVIDAIPGGVARKLDDGTWIRHFPFGPSSAANILYALDGAAPQVSPRVLAMAAEHEDRARARAELLDEDTPVPVFDTTGLLKPGIVPWGHQFRAAQYATRLSVALQAIPMGGGKTLAAIATVNRAAVTRPQRVLIVCPNTVRGVWPREVRKYSGVEWHIVNGRRASKRAHSGFVDIAGAGNRLAEAEKTLFDCLCGAPVHAAVVNYDVLAREPWASWTPSERVDVVIYDEIHRLKAHDGATSKVCARWVPWSGKRIGLTGTPMPQTPLDVFGIYRALDPGIFGTDWTPFRARYAVMGNPSIPEMVTGYQNMSEMAEKFHSIAYRPTVDLDLPPVTDVTRECELEPDAARIYRSLDDELWANLSRVDEGSGFGAEIESLSDMDPEWLDGEGHDDSTVTPANVMVKLLRLQQLTGGTVIDDDRRRVRVSHAKQKLLSEVLDDVGCRRYDGHEPEPVVVFCRFHSDLDVVREVAREWGLSYAEVSGRRKDGLTAESEMAAVDVVAVQIQSGGTGVDLTRARVGIWYSLGYSLSDYDQARKRMDRPGQDRPVLFVHLLVSGTADLDVYEALDGRRSVIFQVMSAHEVDAARLGFTDREFEREQGGDGRSGGMVDLPFDRLIADERTRLGAPVAGR